MKALRKIYLGGGMVPIINVLTDKSTPKRIRNGIIERMNKKELHTIKEVAGNFLHNNIPVTPKDLAHLSKYKNQIRRFAKDAKSLEERRKLLKQNGGFLGLLAPILGKTLFSVAPKLIGPAIGDIVSGIGKLFKKKR